MKEKFMDRYRIKSSRLKGWDYSRYGAYFITICTRNMENYFGRIRNGEMVLSDLGAIANREWFKTPDIRPDMNLTLGEFVVMPNHVHGIIIIGENRYNSRDGMCGICRNAMHCVSTNTTGNGTISAGTTGGCFGPQSKNIASIIRGYKSAVTIQSRKIKPDFSWQARFYDHVIRNDKSLRAITRYIINNPVKYKGV